MAVVYRGPRGCSQSSGSTPRGNGGIPRSASHGSGVLRKVARNGAALPTLVTRDRTPQVEPWLIFSRSPAPQLQVPPVACPPQPIESARRGRPFLATFSFVGQQST